MVDARFPKLKHHCQAKHRALFQFVSCSEYLDGWTAHLIKQALMESKAIITNKLFAFRLVTFEIVFYSSGVLVLKVTIFYYNIMVFQIGLKINSIAHLKLIAHTLSS